MTKDELYPIIDEVLHERCHPYMNAGSAWIDQSDGDIQLRIHPLTEALCDAIVARLARKDDEQTRPLWELRETRREQ